ncbi:MAG: gene transfer agent family protein [Nitratireductor sp.]
MANLHRGEIAVMIDGSEQTLCLTLGALAELESGFGVDSLPALVDRLSRGALTSRQITAILAAGLRGGGATLTTAEVAAMRFEAGATGMTEAVARLVAATFSVPVRSSDTEGGTSTLPNPR